MQTRPLHHQDEGYHRVRLKAHARLEALVSLNLHTHLQESTAEDGPSPTGSIGPCVVAIPLPCIYSFFCILIYFSWKFLIYLE